MDPRALLEQFLGPDAAGRAGGAANAARDRLAGSGLAGVGGGLAAGGLIGLLLGSKSARKTVGKIAGGAVGYGGAAALGALAYRAWRNFEAGKGGEPALGSQLPPPPEGSKFLPASAPASDGRPFELALVLAMIGAANADGHIGPEERAAIFDKLTSLPLSGEEKGYVFDALAAPPSLADIAALADGPEQAAELWLAARLAIVPDHPAEAAWLEALAARLRLEPALVERLEAEAAALA